MLDKNRVVIQKIIILVLLVSITAPAFLSLINNQYFSMHDDQHIARLYLLNQAILQGSLYPRWVDMLGFGFGYPLFNFYPPLIYYISEAFHLLGFSFIASIKLMIITGFLLGAVGMYMLARKVMSIYGSFVGATLFTFFGYRAVTVYVRGAFAEFFAMSLLPFVFLAFHNLYKNQSLKNSMFFGITIALLILAHPLIAIPALLFIGLLFILYLLFSHPDQGEKSLGNSRLLNQIQGFFVSLKMTISGFLLGLGLSAFFWLPSIIERKYTLVDNILLKELANYKLHFVYPSQFFWSAWGYGGSIAGSFDGISFALGKIYISLVVLGFFLYILFSIIPSLNKYQPKSYIFASYFILLLFSLFMATSYSKPIWDNITYLHYLQFPWRFLTFTAVFIAITGGYAIEFLTKQTKQIQDLKILLRQAIVIVTIIFTLLIQHKYFKPQSTFYITEAQRTNLKEIGWRISRSSFEFVPRAVITTKSELGTTVVDINKNQIPNSLYKLVAGHAQVKIIKNNFAQKIFQINSREAILFRLNTYNFPGWKASLTYNIKGIASTEINRSKELHISDDNPYHLITIQLPQGTYEVQFRFTNTPIRTFGNIVSLTTLSIFVVYFAKRKVSKI